MVLWVVVWVVVWNPLTYFFSIFINHTDPTHKYCAEIVGLIYKDSWNKLEGKFKVYFKQNNKFKQS